LSQFTGFSELTMDAGYAGLLRYYSTEQQLQHQEQSVADLPAKNSSFQYQSSIQKFSRRNGQDVGPARITLAEELSHATGIPTLY
jgi:hypothetical protein